MYLCVDCSMSCALCGGALRLQATPCAGRGHGERLAAALTGACFRPARSIQSRMLSSEDADDCLRDAAASSGMAKPCHGKSVSGGCCGTTAVVGFQLPFGRRFADLTFRQLTMRAHQRSNEQKLKSASLDLFISIFTPGHAGVGLRGCCSRICPPRPAGARACSRSQESRAVIRIG